MSLGAIDFGLIVDRAVIIVEAIIHSYIWIQKVNFRARPWMRKCMKPRQKYGVVPPSGKLLFWSFIYPFWHWLALKERCLNQNNWCHLPSLSTTFIKGFDHEKTVVGIAILFLIIVLFTFSKLGGKFIPTLDEGDITANVIIASGSTLSQEVSHH